MPLDMKSTTAYTFGTPYVCVSHMPQWLVVLHLAAVSNPPSLLHYNDTLPVPPVVLRVYIQPVIPTSDDMVRE
jgi:hypothetical protein